MKKAQAANTALLVILGTVILTILIGMFYFTFVFKKSTVFCETDRYVFFNLNSEESSLFASFNRSLCREDCTYFCLNLSEKYKEHYKTSCENPKTSYACGCRCG